jgi:hypothetical protein
LQEHNQTQEMERNFHGSGYDERCKYDQKTSQDNGNLDDMNGNLDDMNSQGVERQSNL